MDDRKCLGTQGNPCTEHAGIVLVQLRPGPNGEPILMAIAVCPDHVEPITDYLAQTWPHDDVWMDNLDNWLSSIAPQHQADGQRVELIHA